MKEREEYPEKNRAGRLLTTSVEVELEGYKLFSHSFWKFKSCTNAHDLGYCWKGGRGYTTFCLAVAFTHRQASTLTLCDKGHRTYMQ